MKTFPSPKCESFCGMISKSLHKLFDRNYMLACQQWQTGAVFQIFK